MNVSWAQNQLKVTKLLQGKEPGQPNKKFKRKVTRNGIDISLICSLQDFFWSK